MSDRVRTLREYVKCMKRLHEEETVDEGLLSQLQQQSDIESIRQVRSHMSSGGFDLGEFLLCQSRTSGEAAVTPLHMATMSGQLDMVKLLIEKQHYNPNVVDLNGHPALHVAVATGHLDIVNYLIDEQKCDPMSQDPSGRTPVHYACQAGNFQMVKYLVEEHQVDPSHPDKVGISPLQIAAAKGAMDVVRYLVDKKKVDPNFSDMFGETSLHASSQYGQVEVVRYLVLEKQCDPMIRRTIDGCTPIFLAALNGCLDVVQFFVNESKCDPNIKDKDGRTPLYAACQGGHSHIVKYLVDECKVDPTYQTTRSNSTPLHFASRSGHLDIVCYLVLEKNCNPNSYDKHCSTPIHDAASEGHLTVVQFFIDVQKCDPEIMGKSGRTAVYYACQGGHLDVVKYLVDEHQVDIMGRDQKGMTPLMNHLAASCNNVELVKYLVEKGCDPHSSDSESGATPFHAACTSGGLDIVKYLIMEQNCDTAALDNDGDTGLHCAAVAGHFDIVKYLVEKQKCDPMCRGQNGVIPLHAAAQSGHLDIVKYFVEKCHIDPQTCGNDQGILPLHLAAGKGRVNCVEYLHNYQKRVKSATPVKRSAPTPAEGEGEGRPKQPRLQQYQQPGGEITSIKISSTQKLQDKLNPNDLGFLMNHLHPIASHWKDLGLQLGLYLEELKTVEATPILIPGGPVAFLREILHKWLNFAPPSNAHPRLTKLCEALRSPSVEQNRVAHDLEQHYQAQNTGKKWEDNPELKPLIQTAHPTGIQLGAGAYGSVEQVKINGDKYAAKKFRMEIGMNCDEFYKKFLTELHILFSLNHPNIVQYKAVCFLPNSNLPALVMEQLHTNLHTYLLDSSYANLPLDTKVFILSDIANGLAYLHNHKPAVIHRDLTARNVLLSSDRVAKISDFGNSHIINIDPKCTSELISTTRVPGTVIYMPPEACSDHAKFNTKLDIFSYGHLALFTATQVFPCSLLSVYDDERSCYRSEVERRQKYIEQLEQQLNEDHELITLIKQCLDVSPKKRPSANNVVRVLEKLVADSHSCYVQ